MRFEAIRLHPYALPLVREWAGASATMKVRRGMLVEAVTSCEIAGWGDCAPLPSTGEAQLAGVYDLLDAAAQRVACREIDDALHELECEACAPARWALETALLDAKARGLGIPLRYLLSERASEAVFVNAALGPLDEGCASRAAIAQAEGFQVAKIKVGLSDADCEIERLRDIVARTEHRLRLRLDANCAWSVVEARGYLHRIADLPIDGVEEPLSEPSVASLASLQTGLPFALAVDESLPRLGATTLLCERPVRRLVIKPSRFGSFAAVQQLANRAQEAGIEVIVTSAVDSAIGVTAAAHLAAALAPQSVHGLGTLAWLAEDVAEGPRIGDGLLILPRGSGLGVVPYCNAAQR